jgi:uncharacterized protein (DUF1015 family)
MADIRPFRAYRPNAAEASNVVSHPADRYSAEDLKHHLKSHPHSFLHVIHPDFQDGQLTKAGSDERLQKTRIRFMEFAQQGILKQDDQAGYYVYRQQKGTSVYTGVIATIAVSDYFNGIIKIHEQTLESRELKLQKYLDVCGFNAEPVLFAYPERPNLSACIEEIMQDPSETGFTDTEGTRHEIWPVYNSGLVQFMQFEFQQLNAVYIADGHHRSASSARLWKSKSKSEAYAHYLGVFFSESQLRIIEFNRAIKLDVPIDSNTLASHCKKYGSLIAENEFKAPASQGQIWYYTKGNWYCWTIENHHINSELDTQLLNDLVLKPLFNITDLRNDSKVTFIPGIRPVHQQMQWVDEGKADILFVLHPVSLNQLKGIADSNQTMPPKSTWIEPKLLSALCIYSMQA